MTSRLHAIGLAVAAAAAALPAPSPAEAHTLGLDAAKRGATVQARTIQRETSALESRVVSCRRRTAHTATCKVRSLYRTGLRECVTAVAVRYATHASTRPRATVGQTICA